LARVEKTAFSNYPPSFRDAPLGAGFDVQLHIRESITPAFAMAYYVYLLASKKHGTLYLGVTRDIVRRGYEHRTKAVDGFTSRYGVDKLVWFEIYDDAASAIAREKNRRNGAVTGRFD
jgi:predicted GIY-YIG superfamily endonuclease